MKDNLDNGRILTEIGQDIFGIPADEELDHIDETVLQMSMIFSQLLMKLSDVSLHSTTPTSTYYYLHGDEVKEMIGRFNGAHEEIMRFIVRMKLNKDNRK